MASPTVGSVRVRSRPAVSFGSPRIPWWKRRQDQFRASTPVAQTFKPFTPYVPPKPPPGSYDPALDATERAAGRGLGDLRQDIGTENLRDTVDYGLGRADIMRDRDRSYFDLGTQQERGAEDYARNVAMLQRAFRVQAGRQGEQINAAGLRGGGAAEQAAEKRAMAERLQRQGLDTGYTRFTEDVQRNRGRIGEDSDLALGRLALELAPPGEGNPFGGRRFQNRTTQLTRAERENTNFGVDTAEQRAYQSGFAPPRPGEPGGRPKNERVDAQGKPFRVVTRGAYVYKIRPDGTVISRRRR